MRNAKKEGAKGGKFSFSSFVIRSAVPADFGDGGNFSSSSLFVAAIHLDTIPRYGTIPYIPYLMRSWQILILALP